MGRWSVRNLSPTTWFYVACSCCTGVLYEKKAARQRAKLRSTGSGLASSSISVTDVESASSSIWPVPFSDGYTSGAHQQQQQGNFSPKKEFVSSHMTMWMDSSIPLEALVVNQRARIILIGLNALGWGCWATMIFLAFYYQFFTLHDRHFRYLSLPLLLSSCLNAGQLILAFSAIFVKKIYRTPFLLSIMSLMTMLITTLCAFMVENDELFFAGTGLAAVQLVYWVAFTTGYGAVVSPWLHPFVQAENTNGCIANEAAWMTEASY